MCRPESGRLQISSNASSPFNGPDQSVKARIHPIALLLLSVLVTFGGLIPVSTISVHGDDILVIASGLGSLAEVGFVGLVGNQLDTLTAGSHFLPVAALIQSLELLLVSSTTWLTQSVVLSYGLLRPAFIIATLLAGTYASWGWLHGVVLSGVRPIEWFAIVYPLFAAVFIAGLQLHTVWSQDPVSSYPIPGWGSTALALTYTGLVGRSLFAETGQRRRAIVAASIVGCLAVLTYEMFLAALAASTIILLVILVIPPYPVARKRIVLAALIPAPIILGVHALQIAVRLQLPQDYSGTAFGFPALVLPTLRGSLLSLMPLTNGPRAMEFTTLDADSEIGTVAFPVAATAALLILYIWSQSRYRGATPGNSRIGSTRLTLFIANLGLMAVASTAMFSVSSKYQMELGGVVGNIYLWYAMAWTALSLALACGLVLVTHMLRLPFTVFLSVFLLILCIVQWEINAKVISASYREFGWTNRVIDSLREDITTRELCNILAVTSTYVSPKSYIAEIELGLQRAQGLAPGEINCS